VNTAADKKETDAWPHVCQQVRDECFMENDLRVGKVVLIIVKSNVK
jgi:hypothetical protein